MNNTSKIIQFVSDLHLEMPNNSFYITEHPLHITGDILIIAGDCSVIKKGYESHPFYKWCSEHYEQTYILLGNHEHYGGFDVSGTLNNYELYVYPNVRYINNKSVIINTTEFFFTTLWSKLDKNFEKYALREYSNFFLVKKNGKAITIDGYADLFNTCYQWLDTALSKSTALSKVVITHHCPTFKLRRERYATSPITHSFYVNVEDLMFKHCMNIWIYGHSHSNFADLKIHNTMVISNQLGYVKTLINRNYKQSRSLICEKDKVCILE
ncbi:Calcineurin-like phosphoesterase domain-containing protein [Entamoeba marina]